MPAGLYYSIRVWPGFFRIQAILFAATKED